MGICSKDIFFCTTRFCSKNIPTFAARFKKDKVYNYHAFSKMLMEQAISSNKAASDWKLEPQKGDIYTGDQVIDAYLTGKKHGLQSYQKSLYNSLQQNMEACAIITKSVLKYLGDINVKSETAFLKINNWDSFNIILPVKEDDFLNEKFLGVYDFTSDLEEKSINDTFNFGVSFLDYTEKLNEHNLHCDGYILKLAN